MFPTIMSMKTGRFHQNSQIHIKEIRYCSKLDRSKSSTWEEKEKSIMNNSRYDFPNDKERPHENNYDNPATSLDKKIIF